MKNYKLGLDIGSTTVKLVVLDAKGQIIYNQYKRHFSDIRSTMMEIVKSCYGSLGNLSGTVKITGSGGLSIAKWLNIDFEQEVIACTKAVEALIPDTEVVIELGGEDAKITYRKGSLEQRMNSSCAGGTGAFIDQMATLLNTDANGLNELAKDYTVIYPIASRCGVFAKTDVQPLLNDGARKEDIAASIFQAVVNQTIGGLACGKPIRGKVAFLGGPLFYLSELRKRFIETLHLREEEIIVPENSYAYPALGAAMLSEEYLEGNNNIKSVPFQTNGRNEISIEEIINRLEVIVDIKDEDVRKLPPLFQSEAEYILFQNRHKQSGLKKIDLQDYRGKAFLGIDAGSTTTKLVLIGEEGELLYSYYGSNEGDPLKKVVSVLLDIYEKMPWEVHIAGSTVTGYGESLIKAALHVDIGEIETIAHYKAANYFLPGVDFILDIGGQDMKCLRIKNGAIDSILLNEACSSGCGSFIEGFAASLNMTVEAFAREALFAEAPVDLGSKCTVFMNSKVKQAQKEGANIGDISAGLSYSVIKNALYKVIKIRDQKELGEKIILQGGTFYNDAVVRSFELISGKEAVRPEIPGLMGAFGAALIAKERYEEEQKPKLLPKQDISDFFANTASDRCNKCGNHCLLTISRFPTGESFISGNRCERGLGLEKEQGSNLPDLYQYKYHRLFSYKPLTVTDAWRGSMGIPRVLNMYENYPFWFTLLTNLGFRVELSAPSSKKLYEKGIETIPSDAVCYPAKLCHGHIKNLIDRGVKTIFYPSIFYEKKEYVDADNTYNCPIVISYAEVIRNNMDELKDINFLAPFLSLDNDKVLVNRIVEEFQDYNVTLQEAKKAVKAARTELDQFKSDIRGKGEETIEYLRKNEKKGIVLCGKPYHLDPEINHGIPGIIHSYDMAVLTEDSISHLTPLKNKLRVVDQWTYNSRLYRSAAFVSEESSLELIQLNSFGCGLDSVTSDQIAEILSTGGKMYSMLKIDEGTNLGAAKIRIRSLKAAIAERERTEYLPVKEDSTYDNPAFTKGNRKKHTILAPQLSPIHFELIQEAARASKYNLVVLPEIDQAAVEEGLKYVNNDACYPAILLIGQIIYALKTGKYDLNNTSVIISQTGGGCRATNYIAFLKLGLKQAGFEQVPIISLNAAGLNEQPGFRISLEFIDKSIMALLYGDLLMRMLYGTRPYEKKPGAAELLYEKWNLEAKANIRYGNKKIFQSNIRSMIREFDQVDVVETKKPKVAIVGEILAKYHPVANNGIISALEEGGAEVVLPDLLDFFFYSLYNADFKYKYLGGKRLKRDLSQVGIAYLKHYRKVMHQELERSKRFTPPTSIDELAGMAESVLSLGNHTGEGWLITAEMMEFIKSGVNNILCVQPLACLPNHITGRGMFKPVKDKYPHANIMPIDYDPGISHVNQLNRIKLLLSVARKNV
jgi:predicted CoA-substrate-specific enzyme activase